MTINLRPSNTEDPFCVPSYGSWCPRGTVHGRGRKSFEHSQISEFHRPTKSTFDVVLVESTWTRDQILREWGPLEFGQCQY